MTETDTKTTLPLFPLGTVLFPTNTLPLRIFEPRYVDLVGRCMRDGSGFGVVGIREGREAGGTARPFDTGTTARIIDFDQGTDGLLSIVIRGGERFRVHSTTVEPHNLLIAEVMPLTAVAEHRIPDDFNSLSSLLAEIVGNSEIEPSPQLPPQSAADLAYALAQYLPLSVPAKVALLEIDDPIELLIRLSNDLRRLRQMAESNAE